MIQSSLLGGPFQPASAEALHVAIIMDGNGRWALERGLPRVAGHRAGAVAVRRTVTAAARLGLGTLTLYAFSADNWRRPRREVSALMRLFGEHLASETATCLDNDVRLCVIGRRDRLPAWLRSRIERAESATRACGGLTLRLAVDYSARAAIVEAARRAVGEPGLDHAAFEARLGEAIGGQDAAAVDLLIRTGGEQRLSDFLLWECAYAELVFMKEKWPDFGEEDLEEALREFGRRDRRYGAVDASASTPG